MQFQFILAFSPEHHVSAMAVFLVRMRTGQVDTTIVDLHLFDQHGKELREHRGNHRRPDYIHHLVFLNAIKYLGVLSGGGFLLVYYGDGSVVLRVLGPATMDGLRISPPDPRSEFSCPGCAYGLWTTIDVGTADGWGLSGSLYACNPDIECGEHPTVLPPDGFPLLTLKEVDFSLWFKQHRYIPTDNAPAVAAETPSPNATGQQGEVLYDLVAVADPPAPLAMATSQTYIGEYLKLQVFEERNTGRSN